MNGLGQLTFWVLGLFITFSLVYFILDNGFASDYEQSEKVKVSIAILLLFALLELWRDIWDRIKYYICDYPVQNPQYQTY